MSPIWNKAVLFLSIVHVTFGQDSIEAIINVAVDRVLGRVELRLSQQTQLLETRLAEQTRLLETRLAQHTSATNENIANLQTFCAERPTTTPSVTDRPTSTPSATERPLTTPSAPERATTTPSAPERATTTHSATDRPINTTSTTDRPINTTSTTEIPREVVFLRRQDGTVDFYRDWAAYKSGFGDKTGEFWLGLDNLHTLTTRHNYSLRAYLADWSGEIKWAEYSTFRVEGEGDGYRLTVTGFDNNSTAGDGMGYNDGMRFTTRDRDNDGRNGGNCAVLRSGAWWYRLCTNANPTGPYKPAGYEGYHGIYWWQAYDDDRSLKRVTLTLVNA